MSLSDWVKAQWLMIAGSTSKKEADEMAALAQQWRKQRRIGFATTTLIWSESPAFFA